MTNGDQHGDEDEQRPAPGSMSFQDPSSTTPRPPTLAEQKAREQAERRRQAAEAQEAQEAEDKRRKRKRILIGGGVTVGVVAVIAIGYAITQAGGDAVRAQCVGEDGVIVADSNCVTPATSSTAYHSGGGFYPIFIGGGGRQYYYNYGGSGGIGQRVSGGSTSTPTGNTRVTTSSGRTLSGGTSSGSVSGGSGSVSRGGLGSSSGSSSSGS